MPAIYAADVWCGDCADKIRADIDKAGNAPADPADESSYESSEYPKYVSPYEQCDIPQHCASGNACLNAVTLSHGGRIGALLTANLTDTGVEYVRAAVKRGDGCCVDIWRAAFNWIDFDAYIKK